MSYVIEVPVDGGESVRVEVSEETDGIVRVARPGQVAAVAQESLQQSLDRIRPVAAAVWEKLRHLPQTPDRVCVEFGIKLSAEAGVIVARGATEANFVVTLEWSRAPGTSDSGLQERVPFPRCPYTGIMGGAARQGPYHTAGLVGWNARSTTSRRNW
ncbi:CU044_2847 family protein [Streptomyces blattellae]|uniref:CU044_2847 family protein n=1 Tax=Streptomyces blattellae TaxID=2569855 RepID=UPI0018AC94D0|nr:CU044_2847 family protein [Streptomyces blattellae]